MPVCAPSGVVRYERRPARKPERSQLSNSALAGPGGFLVQLFPALDFALNDLADECSPSLRPNKLVDAFAKAFRQTNVGRFHLERWPSHARVVTEQRTHSIGSRVSGAGY